MKKLLFFLVLIISSQFINAQARLGSTEQQIRSEFSDYTFTSGITFDGTKYISTYLPHSLIAYYFDDNGICKNVNIVPLTQGDLNYYVQTYNQQYVIISGTEWTAYFKNGGIMHIELKYDSENDVSFFHIY